MNAVSAYRQIASNMDRSLGAVAREPVVERETRYYLGKIGTIKSIDEFIADARVFDYAMKAYGLEEMGYAKAFMRKVLEEGVSAPDSLANRLTDPRYLAFAKDFDFVRLGSATTSFDRVQEGVRELYHKRVLEENAGSQSEGARLALYFQHNAGEIENAYDVLADPALAKVVQVALGLPASVGFVDIDKQAAMIAGRIDFADFKDPAKLAEFLGRFVNLWDLDNPQAGVVPSIAPFSGGSVGMSDSLMLSLQKVKLGRFQ